MAGLVFDQAGNLYGTTLEGGTNGGYGTVFELMPPGEQGGIWTEEILYGFTTSGEGPYGGVIFDKSGNLYGTTSNPKGTVFELTPSPGGIWTETTLYDFGSGRISMPLAGLITDSFGNLYGTGTGTFCGGVFRLQNHSGSWNEAEVDFFSGQHGPCSPEASLTFGKWGGVYGTTVQGGSCTHSNICGTAFAIYP